MASSTGGSNEELPARVDALLSSAIREKARDERALAETFAGMRQEVQAFAEDLTSIKKLVQRPFQPILTLISNRLNEMDKLTAELREQVVQRLDTTAEAQAAHISQESRVVGKFVEEWARYLDVRVKDEGNEVRKLVEGAAKKTDNRLGRETGQLRSLFESTMERAGDSLERQMDAAGTRMKRMAEELHSQLTGAEEALRADVEVAQEAILQALDESAENLSEVLNAVVSVVHDRISESLKEGLRPFSKEVQKLADRIDEAGRRMEDSNTLLEAMQGSLVGYLTERDERLERVRDQTLIDLVDRMSDALDAKTKKKILGALRVGDQRRKDARDAARYRETSKGDAGDPQLPAEGQQGRMGAEVGADGGSWLSDSQ